MASIGDSRQLFVDRSLIDRMDRVALRLHEPVSGGVAIRIEKPWEGPANFGMSVIDAGDRLLMYYRGWPANDAKDKNGVGCVAESRDGGVTWTKPVLNRVSRPDWPDNNIIATDDGEPRFAFPCAPWVDTRPGVPTDERIKMIQSEPVSGEKHTAMRDPAGPKRLVFWASADGFTFRKLSPQPEMISDLRNCFDGGNTMFWSEIEKQYVLYYRWYDGEWGHGYRSMARATSKDLMPWTPSVPMTYGDTPREQFYVNNTQPYFRAPHMYVAPAARFMEGRQAITKAQAADLRMKTIGAHVHFTDCSDAVLLTSRLEINYRTGAPGFVRVEIQDADRTPIPGYTLDDCPEIVGDEIDRVIAWKGGGDVTRLTGKTVRLRFVMKDADLFSFTFRDRKKE